MLLCYVTSVPVVQFLLNPTNFSCPISVFYTDSILTCWRTWALQLIGWAGEGLYISSWLGKISGSVCSLYYPLTPFFWLPQNPSLMFYRSRNLKTKILLTYPNTQVVGSNLNERLGLLAHPIWICWLKTKTQRVFWTETHEFCGFFSVNKIITYQSLSCYLTHLPFKNKLGC